MAGGDTGALHETYARRLTAYFLFRGLGPEDADDAVQEVFARLLAKILTECAAIENLEGWIFGTARHVATDIFRCGAKRPTEAAVEEVAEEPEPRVETNESRKAVEEAVRKLPDELRVLLRLHYWRGWSYRRIAARLGITANAVGLRLHRARMLVRANLQPRVRK